MTLEELKHTVIGKRLCDVDGVDFETCYPVVKNRKYGKRSVIIDVVCAEGIYDDDDRTWATDGTVARFVPDSRRDANDEPYW
jgi:hypothetical protein